MIQIVIPMAGAGSRFSDAGYLTPKPMLDLDGKPMFRRVLENVISAETSKVIFITNDRTALNLNSIQSEYPDIKFFQHKVDSITDGPARTVSLVEYALDMNLPLVVANSDQLVAYCISRDYAELGVKCDGIIWCMEDTDPKWSYVALNSDGYVCDVVEKKVISNLATVGIYAFANAGDFFSAFKMMVAAEDTVNGEYYVAPVYNYLLSKHRILPKKHGNHQRGCIWTWNSNGL